ncbi:MAG: serine/threonine protein kinase, partial [Myxococcota bacterium]
MGAYCCDCNKLLDAVRRSCEGCGSSRPDDGWPRDMLLGITVAGRYRVEVRSGETVLGPIYSGFDTMDKCPVSIRTLASRFHADRRLARVFRHQIKVAQKLEQEHTARVLAVVDEPGVIGYVTEDLDGVTLRKLMDGGKLDILRTVRIARQVGESLAEAHRKGLIHRDICPSNLMVQTDLFGGDRVKVHGYGISDVRELSMMDSARRGARRTLYIAPEQTRRVRARTGMDLYALGTIMFEAIAGRHPFEDPDPLKVLQLKSSLPAPSLREASTDAPRDLVSLVNGMLATKPSVRRPRSAAELVNQLSDMLTNMSGERHQKLYRESIIANLRSIVAPLPLPLSTQDNQIAVAGRSRSRSKLAPIAWGAAMGIALGAVVALTVDTSPEDAPPEQAAGTVAALAPPQQPPASARAPEAEAAVAEAPREIAEAESASAEAPAEAPSAPIVAEAPAQPAAAPAPALAAEAP